MAGSSPSRGSRPLLNLIVLAAVMAAAAISYGVNAASTVGTASATVLSQISSSPVAIISPVPGPATSQQTSLLADQPLPIRLGFSIDQPSRLSSGVVGTTGTVSRTAEASSFGMTLIDVDASGVARFSVAGSGATSSYIIQFPASTESLLRQFPSAATNCTPGTPGCQDSSLIVPARALEGGGSLAVEISQALNKLIAGELSVQVNYN